MPVEERAQILAFFDEHAPSTDAVWAGHDCWGIPATELDIALRLVLSRGY